MNRTKFRRQFLYTIETETPFGFKYNSYSNEKPEGESFKVNLNKFGRR